MNVPRKASPPVPARVVPLAALFAVASAVAASATEVTFHFRPPRPASTVTVAGTFNDWNSTASPMADADGDGVWTTTLDVPPGRQMYKFVLDGTDWFEDRTAGEFVDDGFGGLNSVMEVGDQPMRVGLDGDAPGGGAVVDTRPVVTFRYRAGDPRPNAVSVAGSFNGDDAGATVLSDDDGDGVWEARVRLEPGRYTVQFVLDGRTWLSAGRGRKREPDGFGGYRSVFEVGEDPVTVEGPPR